MNKILSFAAIGLLLYAIPSTAQCGMYTYQDVFFDSDGNLVADNYTEATCNDSSAYSTVNLTMPSGIRPGGFANGATMAEALTQSSVSGEAGDGVLSGSSEVASACVVSISLPFILFIHIDKCACSFSRLDVGNCRLPCNCIPGFNSEDIVQTPETLADKCQRAGTNIELGTCPSAVETTRVSIGTVDAFISFDRVDRCFTTIH